MMAVTQRLDRGLDNELGRAEIGLADAEIDDVLALRGERIGAGQHSEGVFLADAVERRDGFQHGDVLRFLVLLGLLLPLLAAGLRPPSTGAMLATPIGAANPCQLASVVAAVAATQIAQDLRADVRIGIVAQVILAVVKRTRRHAALIPKRRLHHSGGAPVFHRVSRRARDRLLVLAVLAASAGAARHRARVVVADKIQMFRRWRM